MTDLFSLNENQSVTNCHTFKNQVKPSSDIVQWVTNCDLVSNLAYKGKPIRRAKLEDGTEVWVVSDVIAAITQSKDPSAYWRKVKQRLKNEGNDAVTNCHPMQIKDALGRWQTVDAMTREQILRMLQSIPSKKAEPFKLWLAKLGNERLEEIENPDLAIQRGYDGYIKKGKSAKWAKARVNSILHRNDLTQKWQDHGINKPKEFAMLTDRESKGTFGYTTAEMKEEKSLTPAQNLRDHMTTAELLAQDASDVAISLLIDKHNPQGYTENLKEVDKGSTVGAGVMEMFKRVLES